MVVFSIQLNLSYHVSFQIQMSRRNKSWIIEKVSRFCFSTMINHILFLSFDLDSSIFDWTKKKVDRLSQNLSVESLKLEDEIETLFTTIDRLSGFRFMVCEDNGRSFDKYSNQFLRSVIVSFSFFSVFVLVITFRENRWRISRKNGKCSSECF